ncbi:C-type lectin domain family 4 member C [Larimichthys crocea]|uniref:C-type lectin domain family 4 member C n=1 Tax=Larimichthys crocea TaxID=215358 RepID=UPI000F5EC89C|nr:C-type lectin domain family 4 member C [Larimichthys crocea]
MVWPAMTNICTAAQGTEETALMEPEEQIYVNIQEVGDYRAKHQRPRETETKPVRTDAVAREETETWSLLKVAAVCLALLCFLLLTTVIGVSVLYDRDFNQLSRDLSNQTAEKDQLLVRYQNLTKKIGTCPDGWTQFGCSCYFLSTATNTWSSSRQACLMKGADLVIIDSKREMVFLNKLKAHWKFWMGLSNSPIQRKWVWTDGRSLGTA